MSKFVVLMLVTFVCATGVMFAPKLLQGETYEAVRVQHIAALVTDRLRWPQTSVGREK